MPYASATGKTMTANAVANYLHKKVLLVTVSVLLEKDLTKVSHHDDIMRSHVLCSVSYCIKPFTLTQHTHTQRTHTTHTHTHNHTHNYAHTHTHTHTHTHLQELLRFLFREAKIHNAVLFFDECEPLFESRDTRPNPTLGVMLTEVCTLWRRGKGRRGEGEGGEGRVQERVCSNHPSAHTD